MQSKPGDRVFAMSHGDDETIYLFGCGTYLGRKSPPDEITCVFGAFGDERREMEQMGIPDDLTNPCIQLDSGQIVWGSECWWGPEEYLAKMTTGRKVVHLDIEEERKKLG